MNKTFSILLSVFIFLMGSSLNAQTEKTDILYLKNGSVLKGEIIEYERGESIKFKLSNGESLEFSDDEVEKISIGGIVDTRKSKALKKRKEVNNRPLEGLYKNLSFSFVSGTPSEGDFTLGLGAQFSVGKHITPLMAVGGGLGIENFNLSLGEMIYPIFAESRFYLKKKIRTPVFAIGAGYGLASGLFNENVLSAKGGLMAQAMAGFQFNTGTGPTLTVGLGYRYQKATFERLETFNDIFIFPPTSPGNDIFIREYDYHRITLNVGMYF